MGPSRRNVQTARHLRAEIPRVAADDAFIAILADLAASSTPAPGRSRVGKTALRARIAAVTASVALVSVGAAYAVEQFGTERAPVQENDTVDPAGPSEPAERHEEQDEDLAPHDPDEGREHHPQGGTGTGDPDDTGLPADGVERSVPEAPAPQGRAGRADADVDQDKSDPEGSGPEGNTDPGDGPGDTPQPTDDPTDDPDADPDDPDTDADPSDGGEADEADTDPDAERDTDGEVQER